MEKFHNDWGMTNDATRIAQVEIRTFKATCINSSSALLRFLNGAE